MILFGATQVPLAQFIGEIGILYVFQKNGGLGLRKASVMNQVFLTKVGWKLCVGPTYKLHVQNTNVVMMYYW